eukprot:8023121-Pyramimonas_sp.AAC.2
MSFFSHHGGLHAACCTHVAPNDRRMELLVGDGGELGAQLRTSARPMRVPMDDCPRAQQRQHAYICTIAYMKNVHKTNVILCKKESAVDSLVEKRHFHDAGGEERRAY